MGKRFWKGSTKWEKERNSWIFTWRKKGQRDHCRFRNTKTSNSTKGKLTLHKKNFLIQREHFNWESSLEIKKGKGRMKRCQERKKERKERKNCQMGKQKFWSSNTKGKLKLNKRELLNLKRTFQLRKNSWIERQDFELQNKNTVKIIEDIFSPTRTDAILTSRLVGERKNSYTKHGYKHTY